MKNINSNEIVKLATKSSKCEGREVFLNSDVNTSTDDSWDVAIAIIHDGALECLKREAVGDVIERLEGRDVMNHLEFVDADESSSTAFYKIKF